MIHSPTSLRLLDALLEAGPKGAHREGLLRQAKISTATFYRVVEPLLAVGLLGEQGGHYLLKLSHPCNFAFKLWRDQTRLLELSPPLRTEIPALVDRIKVEFGSNLLALWLHGSVVQHAVDSESDIDFLAVVRKEQDDQIRGTRPVQLVTLLGKHFRQDWQQGDSFLRAVLQHGLLLFDHGFAQEYLSQPIPETQPQALQDRERIQERLDSRLLYFIREKAWEDAKRSLKGLAVAVGRSMLEPFGEIPADKTDLLRALQLYFGPECATEFRNGIKVHEEPEAFFRLRSRVLRWQSIFRKHIDHIQRVVAACSGNEASFESACRDMLQIVFGDDLIDTPAKELILRLPDGQVVIEVKSIKGKFDQKQFRDISVSRPLVVIVNQLREIPLTQRPELTFAQRALGEEIGAVILDSRELLQLHNRVLFLDDDLERGDDWALQILMHQAA